MVTMDRESDLSDCQQQLNPYPWILEKNKKNRDRHRARFSKKRIFRSKIFEILWKISRDGHCYASL